MILYIKVELIRDLDYYSNTSEINWQLIFVSQNIGYLLVLVFIITECLIINK